MIASGSADGTLRVWDAVSSAKVLEMHGWHEASISSVVFSPGGHRMVSGSWDNTIRIWDITTGAEVCPLLRGHTMGVTSLFFSLDACRIVSQSKCENLSWDAATGRQLHSVEQSDNRILGSLYITHDGWIVDSATYRTLGRLPDMVADPIYVAHGRSLAVGTCSGRVFILRFPPALLMGPDTRTVEGKIRK